MPWMAARTRVQRNWRTKPSWANALAFAALLVAVLAPGRTAHDASASALDQELVFLPAGAGRTLVDGAAGWTATTQLTAVGCGASGCPTVTASWEPGAGVDGPADGALVAALHDLAGQSGVATVTWRSPPVFVSAEVLAAEFSLDYYGDAGGSSTPVPSTYRAALVPLAPGIRRTDVDGGEFGMNGIWTAGPRRPIDAGALPLGSLHRLEVELQFRFDAAARGDRSLRIDNPSVALFQAAELSLAAPPVPNATPAPEAAAPTPAPATERVPPDSAGAALATCEGEEVVVLGAAVTRTRLEVTGVSTRPQGTAVEVLSTGGWRLGRARVAANGAFLLRARVPRGSPTITGLRGRLADGEQSPVARVQRHNVVQSIHLRGRVVTVEGTLSAAARRANARAQLLVPAADPCARQQALSASLRIDRRTGRYRAVATLPAALASAPFRLAVPVFRTRITTGSPGLPRRVTTSQPILGVSSGIGLGRPG